MKRFLLIAFASFFLLSACGQKGPLYLPGTKGDKVEEAEEAVQEAGESENSEDTDEESEDTGESSSEG